MTCKYFTFSVIFLLATCLRLPAEQDARSGPHDIVVTGRGRTDDEALRDAFRIAVRSVFGTLVDSETVTKDGQLSRRHLVTYSQGVVQSYRKLAQHRSGAESYVKIAAIVRNRPLLRRLGADSLGSYPLDGSSLFAQAVTQYESAKAAEAMLTRKLSRFPLDVVHVRLVTAPHIVENNGDSVTLALDVQTLVDTTRFRFARDELLKLLDQVADERGELAARFSLVNPQYQSTGEQIFHDRFLQFHDSTESRFSRFWTLSGSRIMRTPGPNWRPVNQSPGDLLVLVKTDRKESKGGFRWHWFRLPHPKIPRHPRLRVRLRFFDVAHQLVHEEGFPLGPDLPGWSYNRPNDDQMASLWLTPYLTVHRGNGYRVETAGYAKALTTTHRVRLATSDLSIIHHVDVVIEDVNTDS